MMHAAKRFFPLSSIRIAAFLAGCAASIASSQVTTRTDLVGDQINGWFRQGKAAGLGALSYENRDGGHSPFKLNEWPQLSPYVPGPEDGGKPGMGPATRVHLRPIFGNSSMSAPADKGGSLPRLYMLNENGYQFLANQYLNNNLYFYPEHQDYDPGLNGREGWGDLYPSNLPFMVVSQGSSYTDQPFLQAFYAATAALPADTQNTLIQNRLLIPTLQSIFRRSYRTVEKDEDYFTGKAHPPVFDGGKINEEKMVQLAHEMLPAFVPPVALLEIRSETPVKPNQDFFEPEPIKNEVLGTTPVAIARVFRGSAYQRELIVSARKSADLLRRKLTTRWVLLQGDPDRVKIEPSPDGMDAKITIAWHPAQQITPNMTSHRVDIGVFVGNSYTWSTPAMITYYMPPNEARFYDEGGRLKEIYYQAGNPDLGLPERQDLRWLTLGNRLSSGSADAGAALLSRTMGADVKARLAQVAKDLAKDQAYWRDLTRNPDQKAAADQAKNKLSNQLWQQLEAPVVPGGEPLWQKVKEAISQLADRVDLYTTNQDALEILARQSTKATAMADLQAARQQLVDLMVYQKNSDGRYGLIFHPDDLTAGERYQLRQFHLTLLSQVILPEFLERSLLPAYTDPRISVPKSWRDVYRYSPEGKPQGWTRFMSGRSYEFNQEGQLMSKEDKAPAKPMKYVLDAALGALIFSPQ